MSLRQRKDHRGVKNKRRHHRTGNPSVPVFSVIEGGDIYPPHSNYESKAEVSGFTTNRPPAKRRKLEYSVVPFIQEETHFDNSQKSTQLEDG